jgi:hypothetical protein
MEKQAGRIRYRPVLLSSFWLQGIKNCISEETLSLSFHSGWATPTGLRR